MAQIEFVSQLSASEFCSSFKPNTNLALNFWSSESDLLTASLRYWSDACLQNSMKLVILDEASPKSDYSITCKGVANSKSVFI
jgi:hypothetical protein